MASQVQTPRPMTSRNFGRGRFLFNNDFRYLWGSTSVNIKGQLRSLLAGKDLLMARFEYEHLRVG